MTNIGIVASVIATMSAQYMTNTQNLRVGGAGVDHIFCCCFKKLFFASLCSFICQQAVYQLSGPED